MQILVGEEGRVGVDGAKYLQSEVEKRSLERTAAELVAGRDVLGPALGFVHEQAERVWIRDQQREPGEELRDDGVLVRVGIPETSPRSAALAQERAPRVVSGDEPHRARPVPPGEGIGFAIGLEVRRCVQLEHDLACGHDEGVRRVDRRFEL